MPTRLCRQEELSRLLFTIYDVHLPAHHKHREVWNWKQFCRLQTEDLRPSAKQTGKLKLYKQRKHCITEKLSFHSINTCAYLTTFAMCKKRTTTGTKQMSATDFRQFNNFIK